MANTRNRGANENNNNNANTPPPPTLEKVLIMQAQMLQTMQQTMANMQQAQGQQQVRQCTNRERVLSIAHQLVGPAADWWDTYVEAHEEPETINWQEFSNNFRTHHVLFGMMKLKKKEFEDLKQGSMSVNEYVT
jgi:hypothetical protein